jgi:hypothetical protein
MADRNDRDPVKPSPRLGTETRYSSSAERTSSILRWFTPTAAIALPDLALEEYRPLLGNMIAE